MTDHHRKEQDRPDHDAAKAIEGPGPFTDAQADAVLAAYLPHGRITANLDGRVEPIQPPPGRDMEHHVKYPKVSGGPYGHFAVYADGAVYKLGEDLCSWAEITSTPGTKDTERPSGFQGEGLFWFPQPRG